MNKVVLNRQYLPENTLQDLGIKSLARVAVLSSTSISSP